MVTLMNKKRRNVGFWALVWSCVMVLSDGYAQEVPLYKQKGAVIAHRVEDLLRRMTLHEKVLQLQNKPISDMDKIAETFGGESYGCTHEMGKDAQYCAELYEKVQQYMLTKTRLGIPILTAAEGIEGVLQNGATIFPHALAQGSTFNPALLRQMPAAAG